jgi:outer membrane murein-binding lipoprotein Lpp
VLSGTCPACGGTVEVWFDALAFALRELRAQASELFDDVDAIARSYHWTEEAILALPRARRAAYASCARGEGYVA